VFLWDSRGERVLSRVEMGLEKNSGKWKQWSVEEEESIVEMDRAE
jgi:hypothetical protein